jgi:hypothetical protein
MALWQTLSLTMGTWQGEEGYGILTAYNLHFHKCVRTVKIAISFAPTLKFKVFMLQSFTNWLTIDPSVFVLKSVCSLWETNRSEPSQIHPFTWHESSVCLLKPIKLT